MMSLWDALRMNMMISYQELVRTFLSSRDDAFIVLHLSELLEPVMKNVRDIITRHVNRLL